MGRQLEVNRQDLAETRVRSLTLPPLSDGSIRVAIERFALTANNITYAVVGDRIGYWQFFPTAPGWGVVPVWGFADVVESTRDDIGVGERLYGFFPMASHCDLEPDRVQLALFVDVAAHRAELPAVYNVYARTQGEASYDTCMDDERMLLFPLYATSFCLYDFLFDNDFFGAEQLVIGSASSKTALGLAYALTEDATAPPRVALTSERNRAAVEQLNLYQNVCGYGEIDALDSDLPTVIVDMSGNGSVLSHLHRHLGDNMRYTSNVGMTHYDANEMGKHYIAERSSMFFAPGHIQKRSAEWGAGVFEEKALLFWQRAAERSREWLTVERKCGADDVADAYRKLLAGRVAPNVGIAATLLDGS